MKRWYEANSANVDGVIYLCLCAAALLIAAWKP